MRSEMNAITDKFSREQDKKMVGLIIEAFKEHGFEFETRNEMNDFIRGHCRAISFEGFTRFYVKNVPFFYAENEFTYSFDHEKRTMNSSKKYAIIKPGSNV